jgi:pyruvate kinase
MSDNDRATRIVATLGPATEKPARLRELIEAGLDVARLNMSHGTHESHERLARRVRAAARRCGREVGVMADLQGPKLRLGRFAEPLPLEKGQRVHLTTQASDADLAKGILPVDYRHLTEETEPGHTLLLSDGMVRLRVVRVRAPRVTCEVQEGRILTPRAGLYLPNAEPRRSPMTAKDKRDLRFAVELGVDFIALSFVRRPSDLREARRLIRRLGGDQLLIAKVETSQALDNVDEIIAESDAVMVARGDLGVELPPERVPGVQKSLIKDTVAAGKPVITATQMLESMRTASRPTRAEASDVANAVLDGSWAVMLSAETATGEYPVESVRMMSRIAVEAEQRLLKVTRRRPTVGATTVSEGIAEAGARLALEVGAEAIVALTRSGATARQLARFLLPIPMIAYTPTPRAVTRMTLYRGIAPRRIPEQKGLESAIKSIVRDMSRRGEVRGGDLVVVLGGAPDQPTGITSRLIVHQV